jgi:uncharacterized membrane protein
MAKDQYEVLGLYVAFLGALFSNFIPLVAIQMLGGILFLITIIAIYIIRWKNKNASFKHNHMDYLIKTFWVGTLVLLIGIVLSVFFADHTPIYNVVEGIKNGLVFTKEELDIVMINYAKDNILIFGLCLSPSLLYLFYRINRGIIETINYNKIENLKNWF